MITRALALGGIKPEAEHDKKIRRIRSRKATPPLTLNERRKIAGLPPLDDDYVTMVGNCMTTGEW